MANPEYRLIMPDGSVEVLEITSPWERRNIEDAIARNGWAQIKNQWVNFAHVHRVETSGRVEQ